MSGRAFEWINDGYQGDYYSGSPYSNPPCPLTGTRKVLCGGSFLHVWGSARAVARWYSYPSARKYDIGFRCAAAGPGK